MKKLDLTKMYKSYFTATTQPQIVELEEANYIAIAGKGDPSGLEFTERIQALYSTAYTIKFNFKAQDKDFTVSKLEALWWYDEKKFPGLTITDAVSVERKHWEYILLIRMPDFVQKSDIETGKKEAFAKKKFALIQEIKPHTISKGKVVQMLHVGPFSDEIKSLQIIGDFMQKHGLQKNGKHHEIYLSNFNTTAPEKLKTILREPTL